MSLFANFRSQLLLDRLGIWLKLIVSFESISCHEFASQFGLEFVLYAKKIPNISFIQSRPAIVSPASKAVRLTTESWLGAPIQRTATVVCGVGVCVFASVSVCARAWVHACVRA